MCANSPLTLNSGVTVHKQALNYSMFFDRSIKRTYYLDFASNSFKKIKDGHLGIVDKSTIWNRSL